MRYSIILPVRNGGNYVKECVRSILAQTLDMFNLIVLDNFSTDGTTEWLRSLDDPRIILYPSEKSLTIEENWGRITSVPKNEFITLIGHDDILEPNYLSVMDDLIRRHPKASLYQSHFRYINAEGRAIRHCKPMDEIQKASEFVAFFLSGLIDTNGTGFMMRSSDYDDLGGIPVRYPNLLFADFELFIRLTVRGYKATSSSQAFAFRLHQSTTSTSSDIKFLRSFRIFLDFLQDLKLCSSDVERAIETYSLHFIGDYCKGLSHRMLRTPKEGRQGQSVAQFLVECKAYADKLVPEHQFNPLGEFSVRMASYIDRTFVTRWLFILFKRIYPKPFK